MIYINRKQSISIEIFIQYLPYLFYTNLLSLRSGPARQLSPETASCTSFASKGVKDVTFPKQKRVNDLGGGDLSLTMTCKSNKEGDFGLHVLPPHDSYEYNFRFSTEIYCNWKWTNVFHKFNIFIQAREKPECTETTCTVSWSILASGSCQFNPDTKKYDYCFKWSRFM